MSRSVIGVSVELHGKLRNLAKDAGIPLTIVLEHWVDNCHEQDWVTIKKSYDATKPTWKNIRFLVKEYVKRNPDASDADIVDYTGYSLAQVETITHTAHKRCLLAIEGGITDVAKLAHLSNVSVNFARRILSCHAGEQKIPKEEAYLYPP